MDQKIITAVAVVAGLALGIGASIALNTSTDTTICRHGQVGGALGGAFELVNGQGETVTDQDVFKTPTVLYFGYTYCPDICPVDNARNVAAIEILEERGYIATPAFISVDPERDTPEVVDDFAANLHPRMIGLTGSPEQIAKAAKAYRTFYARAEGGTEDDYLVNHMTHSYLVMPDTGFADFFRRDTTAEEMADRIQCFMDTTG